MEIASFLVVAAIAALAGLAVIVARNSVHSALFLVVNFFCLALLYLSLGAEFLAAVQIIIYAGAIMVLFLFVVTLLNPGHEDLGEGLPSQRVLSVTLGLLFLVGVGVAVFAATPTGVRGAYPPASPDNTYAIAGPLFNQFLLPFEVTSVLLLVAMVGAIVLAKRKI
jgi:NADH-quinone oxidoreductase subunit J